jgi:hypothetical protein
MLTSGNGLLVSLPARELARFRPSGSLFEEGELRKVVLSEELTCALAAIKQLCAARNLPLRFLARPEIFTHGDSLAWLSARVEGINDHLCVSDGHTVRPIPSMRNHVFLYRTSSYANCRAFQRLNQCAPELLGSMTSQVNTALVFGRGAMSASPSSVLLQVGQRQRGGAPSARYHAYISHPDIEVSVARTLASNVSPVTALRSARQVTYVPMTTSACHDQEFSKVVAERVSACLADESRGCVIRLPSPADSGDYPIALKLLLQTLQSLKARGSLKHRPAVILTGADWIAQRPAVLTCAVDLALHGSYEFWKHPRERYGYFRDITVFSPGASGNNVAELPKLLSPALDRKPTLHLLLPPHTELSTQVKIGLIRGARASSLSSGVASG